VAPWPADAEQVFDSRGYVGRQLSSTLEEPWGEFKLGDLCGLDLSDLQAAPPGQRRT
jgi:hypothetical protein